MVDEYDVDPDDPEELDEEQLADSRNKMCRLVTEEFRPGWTSEYPPEYSISDDDDDVDEDEDEDTTDDDDIKSLGE